MSKKVKVWVDNNIYELLQQMAVICNLMGVEYEKELEYATGHFDLIGKLDNEISYTYIIKRRFIKLGERRKIKLPITYTNHERLLTHLKLTIAKRRKAIS